jgi:Domain of unknown function (DUF4410)
VRAISYGVLILSSALAACGTTSNIQPSPKPDAVESHERKPGAVGSHERPSQMKLDLSGYDRVVVLDYSDSTDKSKFKPDEVRSYSDTVATADRSFPDLIAQKLRDTAAFHEVVRGTSPGKSLVVSGQITRLVEGNAAARFFLPGAGMAHFEANTDLVDGESGKILGHLTTDKNSWVLGGGLAAGQSVQSFMQGAAEKIAEQLEEHKKGG